jgi:hypothetical protein
MISVHFNFVMVSVFVSSASCSSLSIGANKIGDYRDAIEVIEGRVDVVCRCRVRCRKLAGLIVAAQ